MRNNKLSQIKKIRERRGPLRSFFVVARYLQRSGQAFRVAAIYPGTVKKLKKLIVGDLLTDAESDNGAFNFSKETGKSFLSGS